FLAIAVLLDVKDIPQVGPLQWGWITITLTGADRSFPARGPRLWPCIRSGRRDFRRCFWRRLRNGDYRRDTTFSVSPLGAPSRSAPCRICVLRFPAAALRSSSNLTTCWENHGRCIVSVALNATAMGGMYD